MKTASGILAKPATRPSSKKPASHRRAATRRSASDRKIDEIVRLARKLKGSFGPT